MTPPVGSRWGRIPTEVRNAVALEPGERTLAWSATPPVVATSWGLWTPGAARLEWDAIDRVGWSPPVLRVVASDGSPPREIRLDDPRDVPGVVRAQVDLSVVFSRRESLRPARGAVRLVGRRSPRSGQLWWAVLFEAGADPHDPEVSRRADELLQDAQRELAG